MNIVHSNGGRRPDDALKVVLNWRIYTNLQIHFCKGKFFTNGKDTINQVFHITTAKKKLQ